MNDDIKKKYDCWNCKYRPYDEYFCGCCMMRVLDEFEKLKAPGDPIADQQNPAQLKPY